ncbi:MAG: LysM peptidoglycan-binding domain-containing protein [Maricaulaceae bacterium]
MSARIFTLLLATTTLVAACATAQENPHYQHSTKFKGDSPYAANMATEPAQYAQQVPQTTQATYDSTTYSQPNNSTMQASSSSYNRVVTSPDTYRPMNTTNAGYRRVDTPVSSQIEPTYASTASYTRLDHRCLRKEMNHQLIGGAVGGTAGAVIGNKAIGGTKGTIAGAALGGALGYGVGDKTVNCDPVTIPITQQSAQVTPAYYSSDKPNRQIQPLYANSQTTTTFPSRVVAPTDAAMPDSYGTPGYQAMQNSESTYTPVRQTAPTAPLQRPARYTPEPSSNSMFHTVRKGDTVYSLARNLCTNIEDVQMMNGIDQNFSIRLGDTIKLPSSKC